MTVLLVALGGALGATLRFCVASWLDDDLPYGTFAANVVGSFLLGWFAALALGEHAYALLGTGFCGGFTTYSAFAVQTARLGPLSGRAVGYAAATIVVSLGAAALGWTLG